MWNRMIQYENNACIRKCRVSQKNRRSLPISYPAQSQVVNVGFLLCTDSYSVLRLFRTLRAKLTRRSIEAKKELKTDEAEIKENGPPSILNAEDLSSIPKTDNVTVICIANPSSSHQEPELIHDQSEDYTGYLSHRSTLSIMEGKEILNAPEYLQQFDFSRRNMLTNSARRTQQRRISIQEEAASPPQNSKTLPSKIKKVVRTIVSLHRLIGLRHILFAFALALYAVGGMFLFYAIEAPFEREARTFRITLVPSKTCYAMLWFQDVNATRNKLNSKLEIIAENLTIAAQDPNANLSVLLKEAYIELLVIDGKYVNSAFYKLEERDYPLWTWTYGTSFFFAFTLYSTIGYGSISPSTTGGRVAVIIYTAIGFPFALVIVRDLGAVLMVWIMKAYAGIVMRIRILRGKVNPTSKEAIMLPMTLALIFSTILTLLTAVFIMVYDWLLGPGDGLNYFESFYFTFLSYAAVGLGDVMPNNYQNAPLVAVVIICGMAPMRVISRVLYIGIEERMYRYVEFVEDSLDWVAGKKRESEEGSVVTTVAESVESGHVKSNNNFSTIEEDHRGGENKYDEEKEKKRTPNDLGDIFKTSPASEFNAPNENDYAKQLK